MHGYAGYFNKKEYNWILIAANGARLIRQFYIS